MAFRIISAVARYSFVFEFEDENETATPVDDVDVIVLPDGQLWFVAPTAETVDDSILEIDDEPGLLAVTDQGELAMSERWIIEYVEETHPDDDEMMRRTTENIALIREAIEQDQGWRNN